MENISDSAKEPLDISEAEHGTIQESASNANISDSVKELLDIFETEHGTVQESASNVNASEYTCCCDGYTCCIA